MKTQQHEARRTTRHSGQVVTSAGLPNSPVQKRRSEVSYPIDTSCPKAGFFRQPLNPSDSNYQGTSHSSSGESSATKLPPLKTVPGWAMHVSLFLMRYLYILYWSLCLSFLSAKPWPSKKARLSKPADDNVAAEPETTPEAEETNVDAMLHDPLPQDHDFLAEQVQVDTTSYADRPTSPVRTDDKPASPVKDTDKPPTLAKAADDQDDDIMITGTGHTTPGNHVALSKHTAKDELSDIGKGKWNADMSNYAHLNAQALHSGFLNCLYSSRDYEAGLVNLMKERYEVTNAQLCLTVSLVNSKYQLQ